MRSSENSVPDCCETTVEDTSSIEDGEGVSGVLLSIARVVFITTDDKWPRGKLLREIADDNTIKEDTEGSVDVPCSVIRFELIVWFDDNTEADAINTKVAVIKDNTRNFWYCLYVGAVADPDLQIRDGGTLKNE